MPDRKPIIAGNWKMFHDHFAAIQFTQKLSYLLDKKEYIAAYKEVGAIYREMMGRHYPAMTAVQVAALIDDQARVEIEVTAIIPD